MLNRLSKFLVDMRYGLNVIEILRVKELFKYINVHFIRGWAIINFPTQLYMKKLLKNMDDTTKNMFSKKRYKEYTLEKLMQIQEGNKYNMGEICFF